jgi:spermidine synthase
MTPSPPPPDPSAARFQVEDYDGRPALGADGVIHSIAIRDGDPPVGYWPHMLPDAAPRSALLLGVGGATLAHLLTRRHPGIEIVGVDNDPEVLAFARQHFDLDLPNLTLVLEDAFRYVQRCDRRYGYVAVDLFAGHVFQRAVLARPFLRRLRALLLPGGEIAVNMFRERNSQSHVARIRRILPVRRVDRLRSNVIVHCSAAEDTAG